MFALLLIREADASRDDDLLGVAVVERFRSRPELLEFNAAVKVPRSVADRHLERHRGDRRGAEVTEPVVDAVQLVVIPDAQSDLHRKREARSRTGQSGADAELEITAGVQPALRPSRAAGAVDI